MLKRKIIKSAGKVLSDQLNWYYVYKFLNAMHFFGAVVMVFFTEWGGIEIYQAQFLQAFFAFWVFVMEVPTGAVADYLGRKISMAAGGIILAIAALIYGSVPSFTVFLVGEFFFSIAMALISGADEAFLYDNLKEKGKEKAFKKILGRAHSYHLAGMMVGALIGGVIVKVLGINYTMLLTSIPILISTVIIVNLKEPKRSRNESESIRYLHIIKSGLLYLKNHKILRKMAIDGVMIATSAYFVVWYYQLLLKNVGVNVEFFGLAHFILILSEIMVSSNFEIMEKISEKIGMQYKIVSAVVTGLGFLLVVLMPNIVTVLLFMLLSGGVGLTRMKYMSSKMNKYIESDKRATVLSSVQMMRRFVLIFINPIMGLIATKSLRLALLMCSLIALLYLFVFGKCDKNIINSEEKL